MLPASFTIFLTRAFSSLTISFAVHYMI